MKEFEIKLSYHLLTARERLQEMRNSPAGGKELLISKGNVAALLPLSLADDIIDFAEASVKASMPTVRLCTT